MFSEMIKKIRKANGLTQVEFASIFNISNGTIAMWETNKRQPDYDMVVKIANYFNVSIDYLLGRADVPNQNNIELNNKQENKVTLIGRGGRYFSYNISEQDIELVKQFLEKFDQE